MHLPNGLSRRGFLAGAASLGGLALAGCTTTRPVQVAEAPPPDEGYLRMYGPMPYERFPIPAVDLSRVPSQFYRQYVDYPTREAVGTVVVDTDAFFLYLVQENGKALRYGVGLGREGFAWSGRAEVGRKAAWPTWTPPAEMIAREPELEEFSAANGGMPPGPLNPLGARALYIHQRGRDTLYRIHGSPEFWSIGKAVSSGCVRLMQQDIIDLHSRVPVGSPIVVTESIA